MAIIDNAFRTGYTLRLDWWVSSQNVAGNYSTVTAVVYLISTGSSYDIRANATKYGSLYIDGTTYNFTFNASLSGGQTKEIFRKTVDIYHGSDGTRSFNLFATAGIEVTLSGTFWGTIRVPASGQATGNLTTIPRKSTIVSISGETFGENMTVNIDQKSSNFTTCIYVKTPNSEWVNVVWKEPGTSFTFTLPAYLMESIPQATSCTGMVKIRTYNNDIEIGDDDWDRWMAVPGWVIPTISNVHHETSISVNTRLMYVRTRSQMNVKTTASSSYGAWITDIRVDYDGAQYWGHDIWTNLQTIAGDRPVTVHVWDSRGRYSSWSGSIYVYDYDVPFGSIKAYRCNADGIRDDINGTYVKVSYSGDKYWLDGCNTFNLTINHRTPGGSWRSFDDFSTSNTGSGELILDNNGEYFSLEKSYEIRLRLSDWFNSIDNVVPISTAFVLMDFKAGGKGLGVGRVATEDNVAQFATAIKVFGGRNNNNSLGSDIVFANCGDEANEIGICGAPPSSTNEILNIHRFTATGSGDMGHIWSITKRNDIINRARCNYITGSTEYQNGEAILRYEGASAYQFFSPTWCGYYDDSAGDIWTFNYTSKVLNLKAGYSTSDERMKYDIDAFTNWGDFYNFYMSLKPVTFKYNEDMIEDTHIGFIAQDVADSMVEHNLVNDKIALIKCLPNDAYDDGREYKICYQEMIALNTKMIQEHEREVLNLKEEIKQLKEIINQLINK